MPVVLSLGAGLRSFLSAFFPAGLVPLGPLGSVEFTLATLPLISNQYIELDINVSVSGTGQWGSMVEWVGMLDKARRPRSHTPTCFCVLPGSPS